MTKLSIITINRNNAEGLRRKWVLSVTKLTQNRVSPVTKFEEIKVSNVTKAIYYFRFEK